ncbi:MULTISPECIES: hypothetical protein [unclassified Vibrio]|uniref:hypothetical protein n=1 Tax=unclassified Vibrio TaxID=2614977 RepID=UPI00148340CE|nr:MULTISPECIES: hypothetical protein [unclassified Vibrio]MDQ2192084.1 hypothetical protein [Vibrio sp. A14(2019)]MDQ2197041.1 hypothetical protein [Vibrio sp. 2017_1457_11]NNN76254.1 hypothetical protein [Vibrio sp. B7]NNN92845.1 hypothetical protein [Vibrio sp. B8-1]NNO08304.1 hypothetical protein [Vibrio sp. B4-12]
MLNSILITFFKLIGALLLTKIIFYKYGSEGLVITGSIINILQITMTLATAGMVTATITITSKVIGEDKFKPFTIVFLVLISTTIILLVLTCILYFFSIVDIYITNYFKPSFFYIVICTFLFSLKSIVLSTLNGLRKMSLMMWFTLLDVSILPIMLYSGFFGSEYNIQDIYIYYLCATNLYVLFLFFSSKIKISIGDLSTCLNQMKPYVLMTIISSTITPITLLTVRSLTDDAFGHNVAGALQGAWRLGDALLTATTGVLGLYYLPKFSSLSINEVRYKIIKIIPIIILIGLLGYCCYVSLNNIIITYFIGSELLKYIEIFNVHIFAVLIKIISYYLGLFMVSHGLSRLFIFHEVSINLIYIVSVFMIISMGFPYIYIPFSFLFVSVVSILITLYFLIKANNGKGKNTIFNSNTTI